jgi:hypothetical protein
MGRIYKRAFVTIVAASAWTAEEGFLRQRKEPVNSIQCVKGLFKLFTLFMNIHE